MNLILAAMVALPLVNCDFESGTGSDITGWKLNEAGRRIWRVERGAGVNGNGGLVWEWETWRLQKTFMQCIGMRRLFSQ